MFINFDRSGFRQRSIRLALAALTVLAVGLTSARAFHTNSVEITEFLADNTSGLTDEDGTFSDWIELQNLGGTNVNLSGWSLTDDKNNLRKWVFPATNLPPHGFLLVFASGKNRATSGAPLHANFSLSSAGEYLALVEPDGVTVTSEFDPYPPQLPNLSYGLGQNVITTRLVDSDAVMKYVVPVDGALGSSWTTASFDDASWTMGTNGVGYESSVPGFAVKTVLANVVIGNLAAAENLLVTPAQQTATFMENKNIVNYLNVGASGRYTGDLPFPGLTLSGDQSDFVCEAVGTITVPVAGNWTFGVSSDDGFSLTIGSFLNVCDCLRGPGDTLATFNFPAAGDYPLRLLFFERSGGAEVELFAARGSFSQWSSGSFRLVGDTASGGLAVRSMSVTAGGAGSYRPVIRTDVQGAMYNLNSAVFLRFPFTVANPADFSSLTFQVKYDDGFVAYLNGTEVARRNAPASVQWNSAATANHPNSQALIYEGINLNGSLGLLQAGPNVLAIEGLNDSAGGADFFIQADLAEFETAGTTNQFFATPTPGAVNDTNYIAFVADTKFSHARGFYETNFPLTITCATPGAIIIYTTNGSPPSLTNGFLYLGPLPVSMTTVVRAAAFRDGFLPSNIDTQTYLFLDDVIHQSPDGSPPPGWPASWGNNVVDYGMDPNVVNDPLYSGTIKNDLKTIPSFSVVMDLGDLFDPNRGIYANATQDTSEWERPMSLELINSDGRAGFHMNGGIRIRGGFSRDPTNPKHAFRFFFRKEYGSGSLSFPLFGNLGASVFDGFDLRCAQNYSWNYGQNDKAIFIRDQFCRDTQRDLGQPSPHGNFYHLYINGQYWGLYDTDERPEASFGATYFGGTKEEYDTIKVENSCFCISATDGTLGAWTRLWQQATNGFVSNAAYQKIQGNNPDGTRNPAYENLLDVDNLIDYMLVILYGGNLDSPITEFRSNLRVNNWYGVRNTNNTAGFRFFIHDAEHTLLDVNEDRNGPYPAGDPVLSDGLSVSSPQYLWQQLEANVEFRLRVADHVQKHFFNSGALTPEACLGRFNARRNEIDRAVVGESARWGDAKREPAYTRNLEWIAQISIEVLNYLPQRSDIVLNQLRAHGLFPATAAPLFSQLGGSVPPGFNLYLTNANPGGVIFYTLDGSDPRLPAGVINPAAQTYTGPIPINSFRQVRARVKDGAEWSALAEAGFFPTQDFSGLLVSEIMYNPPANGPVSGDEYEFLELKNAGATSIDLSGAYFTDGITFTFTNGTVLAPGQFFVLARNAGQFATKYPGVSLNGLYTGKLNNSGEKVTLVHPLGGILFSFTYHVALPWPLTPAGFGFSLALVNPNANLNPDAVENWRASSAPGGSPGADDPPPGIAPVVINEALTHTDLPQVDQIELFNPTAGPVDVGGWFLSDKAGTPKKFRIPNGTLIGPGDYLVFTEADFNPTPGTNNSFSLNSAGDQVYLFSGDGGANLTGYSHGFTFGAAANGVSFGRYLNSAGEELFPAQLANSFGTANAGPRVGPVVINEIQYHPSAGFDEFIELRNLTDADVPLFDVSRPANTWKLNGLNFIFPPNITLPAYGFLLLAPIDPAAFRAKYNVPAEVQILGPYLGALQDGGERLELERPDTPNTNGVPYIVVDEVRYNDKAPWPSGADGGGPSLQRLVSEAYGNDPINWFVSGITPGTSNVFNRAPTVSIASPADQASFSAPAVIAIAAAAEDADGAILKVEFFADGVKLGETNGSPYTFVWSDGIPGVHKLVAKATDNASAVTFSAPVTVTIDPAPAGTGTGLGGDYYNDLDFGTYRFSRLDPVIDFDFGFGSPDPSLGQDTFSIRWTGQVQPRLSGTYYFYTASDEGVRLWVNDQLLIDQWGGHNLQEDFGSINLLAGRLYPIRLEYYDNTGVAAVRLSWSATGLPQQVIPRTQLYPPPPVHPPPTVAITAPTGNSLIPAGSNFVISADAFKIGGAVTSVEFFANGGKLGEVTSGPFTVTTNLDSGQYVLTAVAHDNEFASGTSAPVNITVTGFRPVPVTVIPVRSVWKYLDDGSNQGTNWSQPGFDDSAWAAGQAQLGYGDGDETTVVNGGPAGAHFITTYFRRTFILTNAERFLSLFVNVLRDDGAVVFLNGNEVFRSNMPPGPVGYTTLAATTATGNDESVNFYGSDVSLGLLRNGMNVIAVEIHQVLPTSSDISFDLSLTGLLGPERAAIITQPADQTVLAGSDATFSVAAGGTPLLGYQWLFNGATLTGATNFSLTVSNVQPANAGAYRVVVSNFVNSVTSQVATLTVNLPDPDSDHDGMLDAWELQHGLIVGVDDADLDPDQDGMTNLQEFLAGTDPQDAASYLRLETGGVGPEGGIILRFQAVSNQTYTVQCRNVLESGSWSNLVNVLAAPLNRTVYLTNAPPDTDRRFYRLVTPQLP